MSNPGKYSPRHTISAGLALTLVFALTGCAHSPSFNVLGSYFPGWIACMVAGIVLTALVRFVLNRLQWEQRVPALPLFYFSIALLIACLIWLIAFD
jgi:heme O synthase-like polyprenyltransferase